MDPVRGAVTFHPRRGITVIAPYVVDEFMRADHGRRSTRRYVTRECHLEFSPNPAAAVAAASRHRMPSLATVGGMVMRCSGKGSPRRPYSRRRSSLIFSMASRAAMASEFGNSPPNSSTVLSGGDRAASR